MRFNGLHHLKEEKAFNAFKKLRKEMLARGCGGLISLQRQFKLLDETTGLIYILMELAYTDWNKEIKRRRNPTRKRI